MPAGALLRQTLLTGANAGGGWAYYAGKTSRLEPTCWALLALGASGSSAASLAPHAQFLTRCQRASGWLVEDPAWPINIGFNALVAVTWLSRPDLATDDARSRLLAALTASKGIQAPPTADTAQNNSLQGWSWFDATFSWVEPTSWALLALKKSARAGIANRDAPARIAEADRLLIDRACRPGGWNFGNSNMMRQDLRPYVPTTALALLAMQDRREESAVTRGLDYLEQHWINEESAPALGLSLLCLSAYGRPADTLADRLGAHVPLAVSFGNLHGVASALLALSSQDGQVNAFRI